MSSWWPAAVAFVAGGAIATVVTTITCAWLATRRCGSHYMSRYHYFGKPEQWYYRIVRCEGHRHHRGKHYGDTFDDPYMPPDRRLPVTWSDDRSIEGPGPIDVPNIFRDAFR